MTPKDAYGLTLSHTFPQAVALSGGRQLEIGAAVQEEWMAFDICLRLGLLLALALVKRSL